MATQLEIDALHEAGHVAVGLRLGRTLDFVTIEGAEIRGGMYQGEHARALTQWKGRGPTQVRLLDMLAVDLAGAFVEAQVFPDHDSCWTGDERLAIVHVWSALAQIGETPQISDEGMFELIRDNRLPPEVAEFASAQEKFALDDLSRMFSLDSNLWLDVRRIAGALMQRKTLSGAEVNTLINGKIGRNDPCHCGSGKKYKKCHGR